MDIKHLDQSQSGGSRLVISNGVAYFTGHVAPQYETLAEQTAGLGKRYEELFEKFGLKKENILFANAYLKDINEEPEYTREFQKWIGGKDIPGTLTVQASPDQSSELGDNLLVELALIIAADGGEIQRFGNGVESDCVIHNGVAYFSGQVYTGASDIAGQLAGIFDRYDKMFEQYGLKKERIIVANAYLNNISSYAGSGKNWSEYFGSEPAAAVMVEAPPRRRPDGDVLIEVALMVAADDSKPIVRHDVSPGMSRVVEYNGFAYFTGHSAKPGFETLREQTQALCDRYDELFEQFGYQKDNIVMLNAYLRDMKMYDEYREVFRPWRHKERPSAGVAVQAPPSGDTNYLELQFIVAIDK